MFSQKHSMHFNCLVNNGRKYPYKETAYRKILPVFQHSSLLHFLFNALLTWIDQPYLFSVILLLMVLLSLFLFYFILYKIFSCLEIFLSTPLLLLKLSLDIFWVGPCLLSIVWLISLTFYWLHIYFVLFLKDIEYLLFI